MNILERRTCLIMIYYTTPIMEEVMALRSFYIRLLQDLFGHFIHADTEPCYETMHLALCLSEQAFLYIATGTQQCEHQRVTTMVCSIYRQYAFILDLICKKMM